MDIHTILVSNVVVELCAGKGFLFCDGRDVQLKGFEQTTWVHSLQWTGAAKTPR